MIMSYDQVHVALRDGTVISSILPAELQWLGESMAQYPHGQTQEDIAAAVLATTPKIHSSIVSRLAEELSNECHSYLCNSPNKRMLHSTDPEDLPKFNLDTLSQELHKHAPVLMTMLESAASSSASNSTMRAQKHRKSKDRLSNVASCVAAILLKQRSERASPLHHIIALALHRGGATSHTFDRLAAIGLSMTDKSVLRKLDQICLKHDTRLMEWNSSVEFYMKGQTDSLVDEFQIIGDNIGLEIKPHVDSLHYRRQSIHWFNVLAVKQRIQAAKLPNDKPQRPISSMQNAEFLPSLMDHRLIREHFIILVTRVIVKFLPCLSQMKHYSFQHMKHKYSNIMKTKSEQVYQQARHS